MRNVTLLRYASRSFSSEARGKHLTSFFNFSPHRCRPRFAVRDTVVIVLPPYSAFTRNLSSVQSPLLWPIL